MSYPFFLSYARDDTDNELARFQRDLCAEVRKVARSDVGDGFLDVKDLRAGRPWPADLTSALNSSAVLVCVHTPTYFRREYCGKEVEVFLQRRRLFMRSQNGREPGCIIPVPWQAHEPILTSVPENSWSTGLAGVRIADREGPASVYELLISDMKVEYRRFLLNLARRIAELQPRSAQDVLPALKSKDIDGIRSAFEAPMPLHDMDRVRAGGPTSVTFVYPTPPLPTDWPFAPAGDSAIARAALIAKSKDMDLQAIEFNPADRAFVARVKTARERNSVVVLMLDGGTLHDETLCDSLRDLDKSFDVLSDGVATVVVWNQEPDEQRLATVLARFRKNDYYFGAVQNPGHFDKAMRDSLGGLYNRLLQEKAGGTSTATDTPAIPRSSDYAATPPRF